MKKRGKSLFRKGVEYTGNLIGLSFCAGWVLLSDNRLVNAVFHRVKPKTDMENKLDLHELIIPEVGQKYLRSCR